LLFPEGIYIYLDENGDVYTPQISHLYRLTENEKGTEVPVDSLLVRVLDNRWNHFVPSLYTLQSKLERFGIALVNGKVCYLGESWGSDV
jgi:hypothetical protein